MHNSKTRPHAFTTNTAAGKKKSNADPILSIPNPAYSPVVQKYVTDAAEIIASSHITRNMFVIPPTTLNPHCTPIAQTCSIATSCSSHYWINYIQTGHTPTLSLHT